METDYNITAAQRMQLTPVIGKDGMAALDKMLPRLKVGEGPRKADVLAFCLALHENDVVDFSDWPEFRPRTRHRGGGFPGSKNWQG